ncbi:uncharacterized protein LOC128246371 [Mya arenaria]|uniref:uncharacterized protein LOC128246371 n=1 Tax=Mya arenaria TaxID=6604 RepID=UPI0022DEDE30|nr:uncharacterized protein LOC128246371 [Mya arenaria]
MYLAFCVWEENLPVNENAELAEKRLLQEYKKKLVLDGDVVPDPFSISSGWKGEKAAVNTWPSIYITDIATYLGCSTTKDVMNRLLNEYKVGKAYRYFESEWVKEVYIHDVRESSDKCILKTKVTPSQAINNKCYDVWVIVTKDNVNGPGGEIISAYCSCTAGMLGSCNHVAGLLFRVEHAVKTGATKKSSTSKLSEWNVPKGKPSMKPKKAVDAIWSKGRYDKRVTSEEEEKQRKEMKNKFTPLTKSQHEQLNNQVKTRTDLYDLLRTEISNSCFVLCQEKRRIKAPKADIPDSVIKIADEMKSSNTDKHVAMDKFVDKLTLSIERRDNLKKATLEQSNSQTWKEHRKGRVTASIFQRVSSRVETLRKNEEADPSALVETVLGQKETKQTVAM